MTGKIPRKNKDKNVYLLYRGKAENFAEAMTACLKEKNYDASALNGVHAIISIIDALLVFRGGVISASENHEDSVRLLKDILNEEDTAQYSKHAIFVLKMKTL